MVRGQRIPGKLRHIRYKLDPFASEIVNWRVKQSFSHQQIADQLRKQFNIKCTRQCVSEFLKRHAGRMDLATELVETEEKYLQKREAVRTLEQLNQILEVSREVLEKYQHDFIGITAKRRDRLMTYNEMKDLKEELEEFLKDRDYDFKIDIIPSLRPRSLEALLNSNIKGLELRGKLTGEISSMSKIVVNLGSDKESAQFLDYLSTELQSMGKNLNEIMNGYIHYRKALGMDVRIVNVKEKVEDAEFREIDLDED